MHSFSADYISGKLSLDPLVRSFQVYFFAADHRVSRFRALSILLAGLVFVLLDRDQLENEVNH